jgi:hypothetical protein
VMVSYVSKIFGRKVSTGKSVRTCNQFYLPERECVCARVPHTHTQLIFLQNLFHGCTLNYIIRITKSRTIWGGGMCREW